MKNQICSKICVENKCLIDGACPDFAECSFDCEKGHSCTCMDGYEMIDGSCSEICEENLCLVDTTCPENSQCSYDCKNGHSCECLKGFFMNNGYCEPECDRNQCSSKPCPKRSKCVDLCEGYECQCVKPYRICH